MGLAYDAIYPHFERPVAIKVINPELLESRAGVGSIKTSRSLEAT